MKTIDLGNYVTTGRVPNTWGGYAYGTNIVLKSHATGQKVAQDFDVKNLEGETIALGVPFELKYIDPNFLSGMFRTLIRRQGIDATMALVKVPEHVQKWLDEFWSGERRKEIKRKVEKEKKESLGQWAPPMRFLVPDIGTRIRLKEDWTFLLHREGRNVGMIMDIRVRYPWEKNEKGNDVYSVALKAGTILKVDRIYIRKGVKDYSSITFNVEKGHNSVICHANGEHVFSKKGARFWAKLSDVNNMVVEVDAATLSEN